MALVDIFFPRFCFGCGFIGSYLCLKCESGLVPSDESCFYCHKKSHFGLTHPKCKKRWGVDGFICLYKYNNTFKSVLKKIKYGLVKDSSREIFPILLKEAVGPLSFYKKTYKDICLQPVPLHAEKEKKRGFNQSDIISYYISRFYFIKKVEIAKRIINTKSQAELFLSRDRLNNMRGAFCTEVIGGAVPGTIMIVDDVVTTGSTVKELAMIFKKNQISRVFVFSLAKG